MWSAEDSESPRAQMYGRLALRWFHEQDEEYRRRVRETPSYLKAGKAVGIG
jgi:hypothetical protein